MSTKNIHNLKAEVNQHEAGTTLNRAKRTKLTIRKRRGIFDRVLSIVSIAFDVKDLFQDLGILPDKQTDEFEKVLTAIGDNYAAIQEVGNKVDRNFAAMQMVYQVTSRTLSIIEETRIEMRLEFNKVLDSLQELKVADKISNLATFIDDFKNEVAVINGLSPHVRVVELNRSGGILDRLNNAVDSDGILHNNLNQIINQRLAIPTNENDNVAFAALHIMYYGVQTYVSVMFFFLDQYSFLADFYYKEGDIEKCNGYFDLLQISFRSFKQKLLSTKNKEQLIKKVINILNEVEDLLFVRNERNDIFKLINQRIDSLNIVTTKLQEMILPIDPDQSEKIRKRPDFTNSKVETPLEAWKARATVSYAVQSKTNNIYSKIGDWSDPAVISTKANPILKIPVDPQRRTRLIYRKFNNNKPELVGVIEDNYQTDFKDISRDVYNAALNFDERRSKSEIETLLNDGANLDECYENGRRAIHATAQKGNMQIADFLLLKNKTINVNIKDDDGYSPIYVAAEAGYDDFVEFIMDKGANVNIQTNIKKITPLHIAAQYGFVSTVEILLENNNTDINAKDNTNFTPLHSAVFGGKNVVNILTSNNKTEVNAKSKDGLTPLHLAAINDYIYVAKILMDNKKVNPNIDANGNMTALHFASSLGNLRIVQILVSDNKTNINKQSSNNLTALHFAISLKKFDVAEKLLNLTQIDANLKAKGDITPLHLAAILNNKNITLKLLEKDVLIEARTRDNLTALHIAAIHNNHEIVSTLIEHGADKNSKCNGSTPLHFASFYGSEESTTVLLNKGANIKEYDKDGLCPVHIAAKRGKIEVLRELVDFNASLVNLKSLDISKRSTSLHFASKHGYLDIIQYLVDEKNADIEILNKDNNRPLHYASRYGYFDIIKYLVDNKNCLIEINNNYHETPLHLAALSGNLEIVKYLVDVKNINIKAVTDTYDTALHYAALSGNINLVNYFINEKLFDVNSKNSGYSSLTYAVWNNHMELYKYLLQKGAIPDDYREAAAAILNGNSDLVKVISKHLSSDCPLNIAARYGNIDIVKYYIEEKNAKIGPNDANRLSPLHFAALSGNINLVKYFVEEKHIKVNSFFSMLAISPLCFAALAGNLETVKYLVEKGARTTAFYKITAGPVKYAIASGNLDIVKYFVDEIKVNVTGYSLYPNRIATVKDLGKFNSLSKYTNFETSYIMPFSNQPSNPVLDTAVVGSYLDIMKYFIDEKNISANIEDLLYPAVKFNNYDVVKYLVEDKKANADTKHKNGNTPIMDIFEFCPNYGSGHLDIIKYLFDDNIADLNNRDYGGRTYLHLASKCNVIDLVKYLIQDKKCDVNVRDSNKTTPLHTAASYSSNEVLQFLIKEGANVNDKDAFGSTPLHLAIEHTYDLETPEMIKMVMSLVESGADVNAKNNAGKTPLDCTRGLGDDSKIKAYLISKGGHYGTLIRTIKSTSHYRNMVERNIPWMKNLLQNSLPDLSRCTKLISDATSTQTLNSGSIQNGDVNSTLLLLDVFIRKVSGQKYTSTIDLSMSIQEAKIYSLNIVTEFEDMLKRSAKISGISSKDLNIDFFDLYLNINKNAIHGRYSQIPKIMYESIENSTLNNNTEFKRILKCNIQEILSSNF